MHIFQNKNSIVIRDGENIAVARRWGREFCIACYKQGCKSAADQIMVDGGRLSPDAVSGDLRLFMALMSTAREKWVGEDFYCEPSDARRKRVYARMMDRAGISHQVGKYLIEFKF